MHTFAPKSFASHWRLIAGLLPWLLAGCASAGYQMPDLSLDGLFSSDQAAARDQPVANIGITHCDQLTTHEDDWDRVKGISPVEGEDIDIASAIAACEKALAEHPGHRRLQAELARAYAEAFRYDEAFRLSGQAAEAGSLYALIQQGHAYRYGRGTPKDIDKAVNAYQRAAKAGHVGAMNYLGSTLYQRDGWGDRSKAKSWYRKSADAGDATGMANFAQLLVIDGKQEEAFPWFQRAAQQGNAFALQQIGTYYAVGGEPAIKAPYTALSYFEKAVKKGRPSASVKAAKLFIQEAGDTNSHLNESERQAKVLYWVKYGMPTLSTRQ
ncbi:tetratricopeptide repeat protein [Alloalcanivorax xenomutans]|uniref:tetratricopeptide repeat protein n=1 Tax=Alloalcanivorax xenomutans TaxID=1094342 RepID=UPI001F2C08D4|nr:tetratricopeptide repeat protein [Alloalcanivorax xenomutans]MCE7525447.1 sel1 repeat family protein [Alloalcanivorax xenomutans]